MIGPALKLKTLLRPKNIRCFGLAEFERRVFVLEEERSQLLHILKSMDSRLSLIDKNIANINRNLLAINRRVNELTAGLGVTLENFTAEWVKETLTKEGHVDFFVHKRFYFNKFYSKTNPLYNYEVDCIVFDPLVIVEATSFVKQSEVPKIERFALLKQELEKQRDCPARAYFVTYGIDKSIEDKVKGILAANAIILIDAEHEILNSDE